MQIAGENKEDEDEFRKMEVGKTYHLTVFDYNNEYVTLRVPGTSLRGYIDAKAIPHPEIGQEYDLRLAKKGYSVFQFMTFELEVADSEDGDSPQYEVDVDALYQDMFRQELSLISEEDEACIKKLLADYPHTDRRKKYLADISHLYCRCTPQAWMAFEDFSNYTPIIW